MSSAAQSKPMSLTVKYIQTAGKPVFEFVTTALPVVIKTTQKLYAHWQKLPHNALHFISGSIFCFFGGTFPTLFAAIQAAEHGGRETVMKALADLAEEAMIIIEESKKDDDADDDKDGTKDVKQMSNAEYLQRKTKLVLRKMNPDKVDQAVSSMYKVWLSVAAVLSIQFARTISMALSIADFLKRPAEHYVAPVFNTLIPAEYEKWTPVVFSWIIKSFAMSIAWYIQSVVSAFTSALAGGLMMARATHLFCIHHKITVFGLIPQNADHTKSNIDEYLSYLFAAMGFFFQFMHHFSLPFPLNLVLWPFQLAEYYIRWTITAKQ
jgi:uncharacterized membrane protein